MTKINFTDLTFQETLDENDEILIKRGTTYHRSKNLIQEAPKNSLAYVRVDGNWQVLSEDSETLVKKFTNSSIISSNSFVEFSHNLGEKDIVYSVYYKPISGDYQNLWINADGIITIEVVNETTLKIHNDSESNIGIGNLILSIALGGGSSIDIIETPTIVNPHSESTDVNQPVNLEITQAYHIYGKACLSQFEVFVKDSNDNLELVESSDWLDTQIFQFNGESLTEYFWRARYKDADDNFSNYVQGSFTTTEIIESSFSMGKPWSNQYTFNENDGIIGA